MVGNGIGNVICCIIYEKVFLLILTKFFMAYEFFTEAATGLLIIDWALLFWKSILAWTAGFLSFDVDKLIDWSLLAIRSWACFLMAWSIEFIKEYLLTIPKLIVCEIDRIYLLRSR